MAFDGTPHRIPSDRTAEAAALDAALCRWPVGEALAEAARRYRGRIALVSSFGAQSAVLLHLVAAADPTIPVILVDTGKLFEATQMKWLQLRDDDCRSFAANHAGLGFGAAQFRLVCLLDETVSREQTLKRRYRDDLK